MTTELLPVPQIQRPGDGVFQPPRVLTVRADDRCPQAFDWLCERIGPQLPPGVILSRATTADRTAHVLLDIDDSSTQREAYRLTITPARVSIRAGSPVGLFRGVTTLTQIARAEGGAWRARKIEDWPRLPVRGVSWDVTRGRVPTPAALKNLVDRLAAFKINHLQLYVEHAFDFRFDPEIARDCSPLTHRELTELDACCRERYVELVPSLACFGHMGRVLSLPQYADLAEISADSPWESQSWPQRLRGLTLNARSPRSRRLIESMLDEYLPLFSSGFANVGGDETHDLGRGTNREYCARAGRGRLYVDHLNFLADICRRHGKRMMFWADVVRSFPELVSELPQDAVLLDWGYEVNAPYPALAHPARAGRDVYVCPGTGGWNQVINAMASADANIAGAVETAQRHDAAGMIVTDWGDHGHFNMPACSLPGVVHAACAAWQSAPLDVLALDRGIEAHVFDAPGCGVMAALRRVARVAECGPTWPALYDPARDALFDARQAARFKADVQAALARLDRMAQTRDVHEWRLACQAVTLLVEKALLSLPRAGDVPPAPDARARFAGDVDAFADDYAAAWLARSRPHRLEDIVAALRRFARTLRSRPALGR